MSFFALPNLTSTEAAPCTPWEWNRIDLVPPEAIKDKAARTKWMQDPETQFQCYSSFEGVNPQLRLKGPDATDEGNPPVSMSALCADYDLKLSDAEIEAGLARMPIKPNWIETTLSGNARLVWLFESPVSLPSYSFAVFLLQKIVDFLPVRQLAGLDEPALFSPEKYYTNGCAWKAISPTPVPADLLRGFLIEVSHKFGWDAPEFGPTVPLEVAAAELRKKFPSFNWPGPLTLGSSGPSFFVQGSTSPLSAIVRETGIQTYAAHASRPFYSWSELLGAEFVNAYRQKTLGAAVSDIFYDEKNYFSRLVDGTWAVDPASNIALLLKVGKGLSDRTRKGENSSEVDQALLYIQRNQRVRTAASFAFYPEGINTFNGEKILNTHHIKALTPAISPATWGPEGSFPWLSKFLDTLFCPSDQLPFFLSWLKYFYTSCYLRKPRSGTALFICGGVAVGKTFLSRGVISGLVGGFSECNEFLMGTDNFNAEIFDRALWCVDDATMAGDAKSHALFSNMIKRAVANPSFRLNGKFLKAVTVRWSGRVVVTANTDSESLRLLPNLDISIREKICLLKTVEEGPGLFQSGDQMADILTRELPHLARFLLDMDFPAFTLSQDPRFFVLPYHEKTLVESANHSSNSAAFSEILSEFLREFFERELDKDFWRGTALQLTKQLMSDPAMAGVLRRYDSLMVGRQLSTLSGKKVFDIEIALVDSERLFTISRGSRFPKKKINGHRVPQAVSKFEKV